MPVLSNRTIAALLPRDKVYIAYDDKLPGFGCRVSPSGSKSFIIEYRPAGGGRRVAKRRMTLGRTSQLPADAARKLAMQMFARVQLGEDVAANKISRRKAATVAELVAHYMDSEVRLLRKPGTAAHYEMLFRRYIVPEFGSAKAADVTRAKVFRLHREIGSKHPATANRVLVLISGLYSWAASIGEVAEQQNPARGVQRFSEQGRERFLKAEELARLGEAMRLAERGIPWEVDELNPKSKHARKPENRYTTICPYALAAIKLLMLTGCRLREILHLRWQDVDLERGFLFLSDSKTGRKPVLLSPHAISLIETLPNAATYVIAGDHPERPRSDLKRPWNALRKLAGLNGVRLHDLRHTFASVGAAAGVGLPALGKLLGHKNIETTMRYAHLDADPLRHAVTTIATRVVAAIEQR